MADPYETLGVSRDAPDQEVRRAYRRLVQLHHPDHNDGSPESTRRFEEVQDAYAKIVAMRRSDASRASAPPRREQPPRAQTPPRPQTDPDIEARLAEMERDLSQAYQARERAAEAARQAARTADPRRPTDEELGYIKTDDSFSKILADARAELSDRFTEARSHPVAKGVADLIDELAAKLTGEPRRRS